MRAAAVRRNWPRPGGPGGCCGGWGLTVTRCGGALTVSRRRCERGFYSVPGRRTGRRSLRRSSCLCLRPADSTCSGGSLGSRTCAGPQRQADSDLLAEARRSSRSAVGAVDDTRWVAQDRRDHERRPGRGGGQRGGGVDRREGPAGAPAIISHRGCRSRGRRRGSRGCGRRDAAGCCRLAGVASPGPAPAGLLGGGLVSRGTAVDRQTLGRGRVTAGHTFGAGTARVSFVTVSDERAANWRCDKSGQSGLRALHGGHWLVRAAIPVLDLRELPWLMSARR